MSLIYNSAVAHRVALKRSPKLTRSIILLCHSLFVLSQIQSGCMDYMPQLGIDTHIMPL